MTIKKCRYVPHGVPRTQPATFHGTCHELRGSDSRRASLPGGAQRGCAVALLLASASGLGWSQSEPATPTRFEGAAGLTLRHGPAFPGSSDVGFHLTPAGFLRYGRFSLTGSGGFTTRAADDVERGLAAELARRGKLRVSLGLRFDPGRSDSDSPQLAGMGDVRSTVRARWSARWDPNPAWRMSAGISNDLLGHGGGIMGDLSAVRRWTWGRGESFSLGATVSAGDRSFMQSWHGVSPAQSAKSGLPSFAPSGGLRDLQLSAIWRTEFQAWGQPFAAYLGAGHTVLLGPAADSPLTRQREYSSASGAVVWRF